MTAGTPVNLRRSNRLSVLQTLHARGPMRQAEIARACNLSTSTVSAIVSEARAQGLIVMSDSEPGVATSDRRGTAVAFNPELGYVVGIDIGQTMTRVALGDLEYRPLAVETVRSIVNTPSDDATQRIISATQRLVENAGIDSNRIVGVGLGMPSPQDADHRTVDRKSVV